MPRAAMSVATRVRISPVRNAASARSRWFCDLLPWMASARMPTLARPFTTLSAPCLVRVKISARSTGSCFRSWARIAGLGGEVDLDDALGDALDGGGHRRHRDAGGVAQHRFGELGDVLGHGGREEQRLPLDRQLGDDFADVVDEAHVEHAVGFVEHEELDLSRASVRCSARGRAGGRGWRPGRRRPASGSGPGGPSARRRSPASRSGGCGGHRR